VECSGERLGEDRAIVVDVVRHRDEAALRDREPFGERPRPSGDAEHGARGTMMPAAANAVLTCAAARVDVGDDPAADPGRVLGLLHLPDELVTRYATEAHVAPGELEIGVADARDPDADERLARAPHRGSMIGDDARTGVEDEREHAASLPT
jgi:hypothetical protein